MKTKITIALLTFIMLVGPCITNAQENKTKKNLETLELKISGMTCAEGCAKGIESSVYKIKGVKKSTVNFETETATIIFDPTKVSKEDIIKSIETFNPGESTEMKYTVTVIESTVK